MKINGIKETCIYVEDLNEAKRFYHETLGLAVISHVDGKHIFFRAGNSFCFASIRKTQN
jgi:catechol 2,3-dioxygenase-like lactoylglutathione lyase family enzyme